MTVKAVKSRRVRARLRRRATLRKSKLEAGVLAPIHPTENWQGRTAVREGRDRRRRMEGFRAVHAFQKLGDILKGQRFFGRTKKDRAKITGRGQTR